MYRNRYADACSALRRWDYTYPPIYTPSLYSLSLFSVYSRSCRMDAETEKGLARDRTPVGGQRAHADTERGREIEQRETRRNCVRALFPASSRLSPSLHYFVISLSDRSISRWIKNVIADLLLAAPILSSSGNKISSNMFSSSIIDCTAKSDARANFGTRRSLNANLDVCIYIYTYIRAALKRSRDSLYLSIYVYIHVYFSKTHTHAEK